MRYNAQVGRVPASTRREEGIRLADPGVWVKCSICGRPIRHDAIHYVCSVGGCNRRKHPFRFCSVDCWDAHRADQNHRNAECVEERAPAR